MEALAPESNGVVAGARQLFNRLVDLEFTQPLAFFSLAVVYIASRVPWLDLGYGTDPDAWRVALTANYFWETGDYLPSRLPGYPLHELVTAVFVKGGWVWTNLSTVLISLVGVYLFAQLARKLELPNRGILTIAFAFAPLLWINSVMTMDYMWAMTFIMGAYLALLYRSTTLAGILLGLAAGFRLTSSIMLLPFWILLWRTGERREIRPLTTTTVATAFVMYVPVLMVYGFDFLNFYDQSIPVGEFARRLGKDGLGIIGGLALLVALGLSFQRLRRLPGDLLRDAQVLTWIAVLVVFFISYTRLPHEVAYLIPVFPFGFFLLSRYVSRGLLVATLSVVVLAGFVDVTSSGGAVVGIDRETFTSARIGNGMLFSDIDTLRGQRDFAREIRQLTTNAGEIKRPAVIIVGTIYPELVMLFEKELSIEILEDDKEAISQLSDKGHACDPACYMPEANFRPDIEYVWLLELDQLQRFLEEDRTVYITTEAAQGTLNVYGYRPVYLGVIELALSRDGPSLGSGAASTDR